MVLNDEAADDVSPSRLSSGVNEYRRDGAAEDDADDANDVKHGLRNGAPATGWSSRAFCTMRGNRILFFRRPNFTLSLFPSPT